MGLRVRVPQGSLFHDEKFAFFDFGVRGTPKILIFFLGVSSDILKKMGVIWLGRLPENYLFFLFFDGIPNKMFTILGVTLIPKTSDVRLFSL